MSEYRYSVVTYQSVALQVAGDESLREAWGYQKFTDLSLQGAIYHAFAWPQRENPVGLIELPDGSVITREDLVGAWDPVARSPEKDAPVVENPGKSACGFISSESDFFKRQLEGIDERVYAAKYPHAQAAQGITLLAPNWRPKHTIGQRVRAWWRRLREQIGFWVAGYSPEEYS